MFRGAFTSLRMLCTAGKSEAEKRIAALLEKNIEGIKSMEVNDVSNGCGSMYSIFVEATSFKGKTKVAQHKTVTGILRQEIKDMHGLSISTKVAKE